MIYINVMDVVVIPCNLVMMWEQQAKMKMSLICIHLITLALFYILLKYSIADTSSGYILQRLETVLQDQLSRNVQVKVLVLPVDALGRGYNINYKYTPSIYWLYFIGLGLANRLRIISSLYSIASVERQVLIVIWIPSEDCRINFSAIFSKFLHNNVIVISPPTNLPRQPGMEAVIANSLSNFSSSNSLSYGVLYIRKFIVDISLLERRVTLVYTRGSHSPSSLTCQEHLYTKSMFYQGLRLALPVEDIVNEVKFNYFAGSHYLFGVHVRAFDASYDWSVITPSSDSLRSCMYGYPLLYA